MKYALQLAPDGRVLSVTFARYAQPDSVIVEEIPKKDITEYTYMEGEFVYSPIVEDKMEQSVNLMDWIEAQLAYTAMMTDTLLEV